MATIPRWLDLSRPPPPLEELWSAASGALGELVGEPDGLNDRQRKILERRWIEDGKHYDAVSRNQRLGHYLFRVPMIAASATVPDLASLQVSTVATALVGLVVAILTSLDSFFRYGIRWQQQGRAAADLHSEGWQFIELSGDYEGKARTEAYVIFVERLEQLHAATARGYLEIFAERHQGGEKRG